MTEPSPALQKLLRWVGAGGAWELEDDDGRYLVIALLRCDGGERMDSVVSDDRDLRDYLGRG
ncbi:MAG: hypothetical protein AB7I24_07020 [Candidatus Nanopelagicales bacterium]|jgi:hypothetical protein